MKRIILFFILTTTIFANFEVAPQIQELNLDKQFTQTIHLKNGTNKVKKIKIYPQKPSDQKSEELYMGDWVIVYPKIVYLKPNGKQTIRMAARVPKGLKDGEYRAQLVFEELPTVKSKEDVAEGEVSAQIEILYKLISTIYGYKGDIVRSGEFSDFRFLNYNNKKYIASRLVNTGNSAFDASYSLTYYKDNKKVGEAYINVPKIMRENSANTLVELIDMPDETNRVKVKYSYRVKKDIKTEEYEDIDFGEETLDIKYLTLEEYKKTLEKYNDK